MRSRLSSAWRYIVVELVIYGLLITVYLWLVLRTLTDFLVEQYYTNLPLYAALCLALIVFQGVFLDFVTAYLIDRLGLDHPE